MSDGGEGRPMISSDNLRKLREQLNAWLTHYAALPPGSCAGTILGRAEWSSGRRQKGTFRSGSLGSLLEHATTEAARVGLNPAPLVRLSILPLPPGKESSWIREGLKSLDELETQLEVERLRVTQPPDAAEIPQGTPTTGRDATVEQPDPTHTPVAGSVDELVSTLAATLTAVQVGAPGLADDIAFARDKSKSVRERLEGLIVRNRLYIPSGVRTQPGC